MKLLTEILHNNIYKPYMDQILKLYDKEDDPTYGIYKISLQEVADALGYKESTGSNGKPYYRILHELTADYQSKKGLHIRLCL